MNTYYSELDDKKLSYFIKKWIVSSPDPRPVGLSTNTYFDHRFNVISGQLPTLDNSDANLMNNTSECECQFQDLSHKSCLMR